MPMNMSNYMKAYKSGKLDYQIRFLKGQKPTLSVLDDILPPNESLTMVNLGLVQIPLDRIVGTRYEGRSNAFASNFMPILNERSEFALKWEHLCQAHETEGIRDPIKVVEYMNKFYVEEGNKRVSVMKFFDAISIPSYVTRLIPPRTDEKENKIYYEFMDFYDVSNINYISFSKEGNFARLQNAVGKKPGELWNDDDKMIFSSAYTRFTAAYEAKGGNKLSITPGDAFLIFIELHGYNEVNNITTEEMKELISKTWEEFTMHEELDTVELKMDPTVEKASLFQIGKLLPSGKSKLKIAFIYEKTPESSAWTYSHELGRKHLENTFSNEITTIRYDHVTVDTIAEYLDKAIAEKCNIIFTTTPTFASASVKTAIANPNVRILNCSLNTSHRYIRTYYPRMHEAKFLIGAIAGAMAPNDKIAYIADYPILGNIANINAFALGAQMINPRAKVHLFWSTKKDINVSEELEKLYPDCTSGTDMVILNDPTRYFGLYQMDENDYPKNLAMPLCHWGKFYEKLLRTIMDGTWKYDDTSNKAINYWWGMSSGIIDTICSKNLPVGTTRLINLIKETIYTGDFSPFTGTLYAQGGEIVEGSHAGSDLSPEDIVKMDWLAENIVGSIPSVEELKESAIPVIAQQGLHNIDN